MLQRLRHAWRRSRETGRPRRSSRWRRLLASLLVILVLLTTGLLSYLLHPDRLTPWLQNQLQQSLHAEVRLSRASINLSRLTLQLEGFQLLVTNPQNQLDPVITADHILISPNPIALLRGQLPIDSILIVRPTLHITEYAADTDQQNGEMNLQRLATRIQSRRPQDASQPILPGTATQAPSIPQIYLRSGEVRFATQQPDNKLTTHETLELTGHMTARAADNGYQFILKQTTSPDAQLPRGLILTGLLEPDPRRLHVQVERFDVDQPIRYALPPQLRRWWDSLNPAGAIPDFSLTIQETQGEIDIDADLSLQNVEITLPFIPDNPPRMTNVSGRLAIDSSRPTIQLEGLIEGIFYTINAEALALTPRAPFRMTATTRPFEIPDRPELIFALPPVARDLYNNLKPAGTLSLATTLSREHPDNPIDYAGVVNLIDASVEYFRFAYPIQQATGQVRFDREAVTLANLRGHGPTGATLALEGRIAPTGPDPSVTIDLDIENLPIDEHLFAALSDGSDNVVQMFFDAPAYERLRQEGLLDVPPDNLTDLSPIPPGIGGSVNATFSLRREAGPNQPGLTATRVELEGIEALLRFWPYPVRVTDGSFTLTNDRLVIDNVAVSGPTGATGRINASVHRDEGTGRLEGPIHVTQTTVPIDPYLLATIPAGQRDMIAELRPTGTLQGDITIDLFMDRNADFTVNANVLSGSLTPYDGDYRFLDVNGSFTLTEQGITSPQLTGTKGPATFAATGSAHWDGPNANTYQASVEATNLILEASLADIITPGSPLRDQADRLIAQRNPTGQVNANLRVTKAADQTTPTPRARLAVQPQSAAFDANGHRFEVFDLSGQLILTNDALTLDNLAGRSSSGRFSAQGSASLADTSIDLTINASADRVNPTTRALLPAAVNDLIDDFQLEAAYAFDGRLTRTSDQEPLTRVTGQLNLDDAAFTPGLPITNASGSIRLDIQHQTDQTWPRIEADAAFAQLQASKYLLKEATIELSNAEDPSHLLITNLLADIYGGALSGQGSAELGAQGWYRFGVDIVEADLTGFRQPPDLEPPTPEQRAWIDNLFADWPTDQPLQRALPPARRPQVDGLLSASLQLEGQYGQPDTRMGRGAIYARQVGLLNQPLSLAILRAFNLTTPTGQSLDEASMRFLLDGDWVRFDGVRFAADDFAIVGAGNMNYETQELDLILYSRSQADPGFGILRFFDGIRDQVAAIRVQGTIDQPATSVFLLPGLRDALDTSFGSVERPAFLDNVFNDPLP